MLLSAIRDTAHGKPGAANPAATARSSLVSSGGGGGLGALPSPLAGIPGAATELQEVELLLQSLKTSAAVAAVQMQYSHGGGGGGSGSGGEQLHAGGGAPGTALRAEGEAACRALQDDNRELKAELLAARRLLQERVGGRGGGR